MKALFISQELWELVEGGYEEPPDTTTLQVKQGRKGASLYSTRVSTIFSRIIFASRAKVAWEMLKQEFKGSVKVISIKLQSLWRDFDNITMKDNDR